MTSTTDLENSSRRRGLHRVLRFLAIVPVLGLLVQIGACGPTYQTAGPPRTEAALTGDALIMADGYSLPVRVHRALGPEPLAVVVALHGFNDYSHAWAESAGRWSTNGLTVYAYDQRGFGQADRPGIWPGVDTLTGDLRQVIGVVRERHPGKPLYLVGESMGGAVIMALLGRPDPPAVDGAVLAAPAVWSRKTMANWMASGLEILRTVIPGVVLTGEGIRKQASDNIEMLIGLGRDPLVIKGARVDAISGLVDLMDAAYEAAPKIETPLLVLYGERDEIVPQASVEKTLDRMTVEPDLAFYPNGWHLLFRDLNGPIVQHDVWHWIVRGGPRLPSGADRRAETRLARSEQ
jgi:alpha-beta hydrolase superfamily lysophospholipase